MRQIVFVTNNQHKLIEIRHLAKDKFQIQSLQDVDFNYDIPETSPTLEGNALEKARFFYKKTGKNCFADDTGLEVHALGGLPGVNSARFASDHDYNKNMMHLLELMKDIEDRRARFRTVIALILDGKEFLFEGIVNGHITYEPRGQNGFGYDPIFVPQGDNRTFAQMTLDEKNLYSHRQKAFSKLIDFLQNVSS